MKTWGIFVQSRSGKINLEGLKYKYNYIKTFAWQNLPKTKSTFAKPKEKCLQNIKQKAN